MELNAETTSKEFKKGWEASKKHEGSKSKRITELEKELAEVKNIIYRATPAVVKNLKTKLTEAKAENVKLKEYGHIHIKGCLMSLGFEGKIISPCTCGLNDLLNPTPTTETE